jgi:hypothetical protein
LITIPPSQCQIYLERKWLSEEYFTIEETPEDATAVPQDILQSSLDGSENSGDPNPENIPLSAPPISEIPKYSIPIALLQKMTQVRRPSQVHLLSLSLDLCRRAFKSKERNQWPMFI